MPPHPTLSDVAWTAPSSLLEGYDPCAELSWIPVTLEGGTVSTPWHIMLFHRGEYIGTATKDSYGFEPEITRIDDGTMEVIYRWPQGSDANAAPSGRSVATFTWNPQTEQVDFSGEVPPSP